MSAKCFSPPASRWPPTWGRLALCAAQREAIQRWLGEGLRLTKIRKLLARHGVAIAYSTLYRFAVLELQFGQTAATIPVLDGEPGHELQVDTGWVGWLTLPLLQKRRRFRAWIFTAVRSRHRFVYPTFEETTARAIEACEAAWEFFGGVFTVLMYDYVTRHIIVRGARGHAAEVGERTDVAVQKAHLVVPLVNPREVAAGVHQPHQEQPRFPPDAGEIDEHLEEVDFRELAGPIRQRNEHLAPLPPPLGDRRF